LLQYNFGIIIINYRTL